jgi:hypothetical protein
MLLAQTLYRSIGKPRLLGNIELLQDILRRSDICVLHCGTRVPLGERVRKEEKMERMMERTRISAAMTGAWVVVY